MKKKFRKGISLMMAATMSLTLCMSNVSVKTVFAAEGRKVDVWDFGGVAEANTDLYNNNISPEYWDTSTDINDGGLLIAGTTSFGDLAFNHNSNDRIYAPLAKRSAGTYNGAKTEYTDGYTANGMWYVNGTGGPTRRYIQVDNVVAGDQVVVYMGSTSGDSTLHFLYMGTDGKVQDDTGSFTTKGNKYAFIAEHSGSYKIYTDASAGKAFFNRVVRAPGVAVSGNIDMGKFALSDYSLDFTNDTTNIKTQARVKDGKYNVVLAPGYTYTATISGIVGYGFTNDTKKVATEITEVMSGKNNVTLKVEEKSTYVYSGQVTGFDSDYDVSKLVITMKPVATSLEEDVILKINSDMTFSATLSPDVEYTAEMAGVNDYYISSGEVVNANQPLSQDIEVLKKPVYAASGKFLNLPSDSVVSTIEFINEEDSYRYTGTVRENEFFVSLRDGAYSVKATVDGYKTNTHLLVKDSNVTKDLLFVLADKKATPVAWVSDIYVGYPNKDNNYSTVNDAMKACDGMNIQGEEQRVTVHIAPGTYREQIFVTAPYVSLVNDEPGEVLLTWYYGIGYKYYSADTTGYYNLENAYDQYAKASVAKWGCATYIKSTAVGFKAKNITFESSFNRYITDEEIEDGVALAGDSTASPINFERKYGVDVTSRAATERSAALVVEADQTEFENCSFLGGQDTLYTGSANNSSYYKNCTIEGNTDFIFGDGNVVFDGCNIKWKGYSDANPVGGYLTAAKDAATNGYLFRNCTISANTELTVKSGYFGRPWGAGAKVIFLNTKLTDKSLIADAGWADMSGNTAPKAKFGEYNTTLADGGAVDTTNRVTGVMDASTAATIDVANYFGSWQPASYTEDGNSVAFEKEPYVTSNGDLNIPYPGNTITVNYSLGSENDKNDASVIRWYRVDQTTKAKTLVKASTANTGKSYKITVEDENYNIEVEVSPETFSGQKAEPKIYQIPEYVRVGYEDPSSGGDITLGDGVNIFLAGDSTVKDYSSAGMYMSGKPLASGSWGEYLQAFFDQKQVKVQNYANGGRSSRSFINEGSLDKIADNIKSGDYLFIQFGHNDCSNGAGYLQERFVPLGEPATDGIYPSTEGTKVTTPDSFVDKYGPTYYAYDSNGTYKWYLQQYIDVAIEAGAIPVLVTPVARQYYTSEGTIRPHHDSTDKTTNTQVTENNAYVTAVKQLAEEQGVHLIDAFALTKDLYEAAYQADPKAAEGKSEYGPQVMGEGDSTHSNKLGGFISGALMAQEIQALNINISSAVKLPAQVLGQTPENQDVFSVNGKSQLTTNSAPYWQVIGQDLINDIGNYSAPPTGPKPTVWIIGDSTVSSFNDDYYYPRYGWGTQIESYLDGTFDVQNIALSGRSSKSYMADPQYQTLLKGMKSGDYLLIGFGHNDEKAEEERYTNPNGTYEDQGSFANSLYENYIKQAEAVGCQVVLSTPIVRRTETGNWSNSNLHKTTTSGAYPGGDYALAIKDLGAALTIPVVDMTTLTKELYDQLGIAETINLHAWTSSKSSSVDNTHTNIWGAKYNAYLITKTIKELNVNGLAKHIKSENAPQKDSTLVKNPNYKESSYSNDLAQSSLWEDIGGWKGSVFGDVGGNPSIANQILEQDEDGNMHMAVKNNKGKIAGTSDGIAMYYHKVPANSTFSLSAKARINSFDVNDQVSFGLMARDDMYIDTNSKEAMGDYVAAGPLKLANGPVWNSFARKSGVLTQGGTAVNAIKAGDTVELNITGTSDGYSCKFGDEETITGGFDFKLTKVDSDYVYVGMFVARNADITFSDIKLVIGEESVERPTASLTAGTYTTSQSIELFTETEGATIYYTTNGDNPTLLSKQYDESLTVNKTTIIKAMAVKDGMADSDIAVFEYVINNPSVLEVIVSPAKTSVQKGNTKQFKADLLALDGADQSVTWAVIGGSDSNISADGLLEVGPEETAEKLTIIAISDSDNSKEGTAEVTVTKTQVTYHTVAVSAVPKEGGRVFGGGEVAKGDTAEIVAKANDGYIFTKWIDNDSYNEYTSSASISLNIEYDRDFTAVFEPLAVEGIRIAAGPTTTIYSEGESFNPKGIIVMATYSDGTIAEVTDYRYTPSGALSSSDQEVTIRYGEAVAHISITVKKAAENYRITASAGRGGTISPSGDVNVKEGDNKTFTIKANSGYYISDIIVDGKSMGAKNQYTFSDVTQDHTIKAMFNPEEEKEEEKEEEEEEEDDEWEEDDTNDKEEAITPPSPQPNPEPIPAPELISVEEISNSIDTAITSGKTPTISIPKNGGVFEISKEISSKLKDSNKDLVIKGVGTQFTLTSDVLGQLSDTILSVSVSNLVEASYNQVKTAVAKEKNTSLIGDATLTTELMIKSDRKPVERLAERLAIEIDLSNHLEQIKDTSKLTVARVIEIDGKTQIIKIGGEYNKDTKTFKAYSDQAGQYILLECDNIKKINLTIGKHVSTINGIAKTNDAAPVIINDTTMMPLRFITENLGGTIAWDEKTQEITLNIDGTQLKMRVGTKVEGYDISPVIQNGRTLVPLRYISEAIGANVTWVSKTKGIEIVR